MKNSLCWEFYANDESHIDVFSTFSIVNVRPAARAEAAFLIATTMTMMMVFYWYMHTLVKQFRFGTNTATCGLYEKAASSEDNIHLYTYAYANASEQTSDTKQTFFAKATNIFLYIKNTKRKHIKMFIYRETRERKKAGKTSTDGRNGAIYNLFSLPNFIFLPFRGSVCLWLLCGPWINLLSLFRLLLPLFIITTSDVHENL